LDTSACLAFLEDEEVPLLSDKNNKEGMSPSDRAKRLQISGTPC